MPARKLTQADLDDLRDADNELLRSRPRAIVRHNDDNEELTITAQTGIAAWKGISESHFYALKRNGWRLKRGVPYEDQPHNNNNAVSGELLHEMFELMQERIEGKDRRIAELEAELETLRGERD